MKKIFFILGVLALMGLTTACVETQQINPNFDAKTNSVNTKFVLNVATGTTPTKQSSTTVQENTNFRGMVDAKLISMISGKVATSGAPYLAPYDGSEITDATKFKTYELGTLYSSDAITPANNQASSSHRVIELQLPLSTDAMLFYGKAPASGGDAENGKVTMTFNSATPWSTTFSLVSRMENSTALDQTCALSAYLINYVCDAAVTAVDAGAYTYQGVTNAAALPAKTWKELAADFDNTSVTQSAMEETMGKTLSLLINAPGFLSGSSFAVIRMMGDIYTTVTAVYNSAASGDADLNAQRVAYEVQQRIAKCFTISSGKVTGFATRATLGTNSIVAADASAYTNATDANMAGFPAVFDIPEGSTILQYASNAFSYKTSANSLLNASDAMVPTNYRYPAELYYFCNSLLRVTDEAVTENQYPNGVNPWVTASSWNNNGWAEGKVSSSTRSVAVKNNINYGVALLKSSVAYTATDLEDNRANKTGETTNNTIAVSGNPFALTGVLVGGQPNTLDWHYLAKSDATWGNVIYDTAIPNTGVIPTTTGNEIYTLVFDNYNASGQADVLVALEFVNNWKDANNNPKDFYGKDGIIPAGGKFYLVGKLELGSKTITAWDSNYPVPPYNADGTSTETTRIFVQDFMTTAVFKIGATSLQNAFVTVPDLRSAQMSLGLSVDIQWQTGLTFDNVILGSN